ncbi:MAG: N-acetylmuramoyl-L-alanine amidase, partial [Anaerolineae bacterium]
RARAALQAQAIAARTYASRGCLPASAGDPARCEPGLDANVDTTTRTQVWRPVHYDVSDLAVLATHGQAVFQSQRLIPSLYFARTFERTLSSAEGGCCGGRAWSFLVAVSSPDPFRRRLGHGTGMSQEGAATFAAWGATPREILEHYYSGVTVPPPGQPSLRDPIVEPRAAAVGQPVGFRVSYADPDADPPAIAEAVLDANSFAMHPPGTPDYRAGAIFAVTRTLAAGPHTVRFRFGDGYTDPVEIDAGSIQVGGLLDARPGTGAGLRSNGNPKAAVVLLKAADLATTRGEATRDGGGVSASGVEAVELVGPIRKVGVEFMAVGARVRGPLPEGSESGVSIRASRDGATWSGWVPLQEDEGDQKEAPPAGEWWSRLVILRGRYLQVRVILRGATGRRPAALHDITLYAIDAAAGPSAPVRSAAASGGPTAIIDRAGWGADEGLRFDSRGVETWPVKYTRPRAVVVHHTVTAENPADPAAVVRAIYYYHAVSRGWGDIGYNFLVDHRGNVYAGRYGGERDGLIAQGGHARQFNPNTIGVALLGTFTAASATPSAAALDSLEGLLASRGQRYGIDGSGPVRLAGVQFPFSLLGHRDVLPGVTQCPGDGVGGLLDEIRAEIARRVGALPPATATPEAPSKPTPPVAETPTATLVPGCSETVAGGDFESDDPRWERRRAYLTAWDARSGQQ